jgi:hypothetical protein
MFLRSPREDENLDFPNELRARLGKNFPWYAGMQPENQELLISELITVSARDTENTESTLRISLLAWDSTAHIISEGYTPDSELDWIQDTEYF